MERLRFIVSYGRQLVEAGVCSESDLNEIWDKVKNDIRRILILAIDDEISPRIDVFGSESRYIEEMMFSNEEIRSMEQGRGRRCCC